MEEKQYKTINGLFENQSFYKPFTEQKKNKILHDFSKWISKKDFSDLHLSLFRFADGETFEYFYDSIIDQYLSLLNKNPQTSIKIIIDFKTEISQAIFSMLRSEYNKHLDDSIELISPMDFIKFDNLWQPEYIRYCEQIFNHLIQIPLGILGEDKSKQYSLQTLSERVKTLNDLGFCEMTRGFDSIVRNGYSHGHINFGFDEVSYFDKHRSKVLSSNEFSEMLDNLVDNCHSAVAALLIFVCNNRNIFIKNENLSMLPLGLRHLIIDGISSNFKSSLISSYEIGLGNEQKQINLDCYVHLLNRNNQLFEALYFCWNICKYNGKEYAKIVVTIHSSAPLSSLLVVDGNELYDSIVNRKPIENLPKIILSELFWYKERKFTTKAFNFTKIFLALLDNEKKELINSVHDFGFIYFGQYYSIIQIENSSPSKMRRITAHVVLKDITGEINSEFLTQIITVVIKKLKGKLVKKKGRFGEKGLPWFPFFITVKLYSNKMRLRKLKSLTFNDCELLSISEWCRNWNKLQPFYTKKTNCITKSIRVRFNDKLIKIIE